MHAIKDCQQEEEDFRLRDLTAKKAHTKLPIPQEAIGLVEEVDLEAEDQEAGEAVEEERIPDNVNEILDKVELLRVLCLGQGDVMFSIGVLRRSHSKPFNVISVLTHYRVVSSDNISDWYEWWPWTGDMLSATDFLIVQPSFASPESSLQT
ncbi:unnamed protein product [Calypogeia fissa]